MQKIIITGNLGGDAALQASKSDGKVYTKISIASPNKDKKTIWYSALLFGKRAEGLTPFLKKGVKVLIEGDLNPSAYINKANEPACDLTILVQQIEILGSKEASKDSYFQEQPAVTQNIQTTEWKTASADECPF